MSTETIRVLRDLRHPDVTRVPEIFTDSQRTVLFEKIISSGRSADAMSPLPNTTTGASRYRPTAVTRPWLLSGVGALAVAAIALVLAAGSAVRPQPADGAVTFRTATNGDIVVSVRNPFVALSQLNAAFAAHGIHITVNLTPVSPSLVGTMVYSSDSGGADQIQALNRGSCLAGGGACPVGLRIPSTFKGVGYITLGRRAKPGETYNSTASAFAPGEALHCSGILGARVSTAMPVLRARNLSVVEWRLNDKIVSSVPADSYIWQIDPVASGKVRVWAEASPWPDTSAAGSIDNKGCTN